MRKITKECVNAFLNAKLFKKQNNKITVLSDSTIWELYDTRIARLYNDKTLEVQTGGWNSATTKEKLNSLPNVHITTKNGTMYLNGKEWNGKLITIY